MAVDKSIMQAALANLRKELRGHKGPVVITVESGHPASDDEDGEEPGGEEPAPKTDLLDKAMKDLKKK